MEKDATRGVVTAELIARHRELMQEAGEVVEQLQEAAGESRLLQAQAQARRRAFEEWAAKKPVRRD